MEKLVSFVGAEEIYVARQKKEKIVLSKRQKKGTLQNLNRAWYRKAETERQGIKFHHRKNTSRKWTR